jgi:heterodisulfide reductase subunit C
MRALLGLEEALVCADSLVWDCTTCYTCAERCPQGVKPIEVVTAVKNKIAEAGLLPRDVKGAVENIRNTGRVIRHTDAVDRHRQELSLPPLGGSVKFIEEVLER